MQSAGVQSGGAELAKVLASAGGGPFPSIIDTKYAIDSKGSSGDSLTVTWSSAPTAGQLLILIALSSSKEGSNTMITPSGYTELAGSDNLYCGVYYKIATGTEGTTAGIANFQTEGCLIGLRLSGVYSTPIDTSGHSSSATSSPSITTTHANELLLAIACCSTNTLTTNPNSSPPSGWTMVSTQGDHTGGGAVWIAVASKQQATAGASGAAAWGAATGSDFMIGLRSV